MYGFGVSVSFSMPLIADAIEKSFQLLFSSFSLRCSTKSSTSTCFDSGNNATVVYIFSGKFMLYLQILSGYFSKI